jgi:hypothetical protein
MADHEDAQDYTANGPSNIGFRTGGDGNGIANGVVAVGTQIGVRGICAKRGDQGSFFCGVFGESKEGIGVQGQSATEAGVIGISDSSVGVKGLAGKLGDGVRGVADSGVGVRGSSSSNDGIAGSSGGDRRSGVFGDNTDTKNVTFGVSGRTQSPQGAGVNGFSVPGIGVRGTSTTNDGIVGTSSGDRKSGVFGDNTDTTRVTFGVSGRSQSPQGAGVFGFSDLGYGGQFSGARAPLRLQPGTTVGRPTTGNHQTGEFFVDRNGDLFFCKVSGTPGTWFLVQLGA